MPTQTVITEQMRSFIGAQTEPVTYRITHREIARFNAAIAGKLPPIESDPERQRQPATKALPTFVRSLLPAPFDPPFPEPFHDILDGGSTYTFNRPIVPGDSITVVRKLTDIYEKTGRIGTMLFKISEVTYTDQDNKIVATQTSTTITYGRKTASDD